MFFLVVWHFRKPPNTKDESCKSMYIRLLTAQAVVYAVISDNIPCKADIITFNFKVQYSFIQEERLHRFQFCPRMDSLR